MKKILLVAALSAFAVPAWAADMAVKAPPVPFINYGSGWYVGFGSEADVAQAKTSGNNFFAPSLATGNLTATGGSLEVVVGFISGAAGRSWIIENTLAWSNISGSNSVAATATSGAGNVSVASRWSDSEDFYIETSFLQKLLSIAGNIGLGAFDPTKIFPSFTPIVPSNIAVAASPRNYWGVGIRAFGVDGNIGAAHGVTIGFAPTVNTKFLWQTVDSSGRPDGGALSAKAWIGFPIKGKTLANVFAANGTPLTINGGMNMGTQYGLGLTYERGVSSYNNFLGL
jgi:hypothetical protein